MNFSDLQPHIFKAVENNGNGLNTLDDKIAVILDTLDDHKAAFNTVITDVKRLMHHAGLTTKVGFADGVRPADISQMV